MYQPFSIDKHNVGYLLINYDTKEKSKLKIIVTDTVNYCKQYTSQTNEEFMSKTFDINKLSNDDYTIIDSIYEKFIQIQSSFKPIINKKDKMIELNEDLDQITLSHNEFKYTLPIETSPIADELSALKLINNQTLKFTQLQSQINGKLLNELDCKNLIINELSNAYYYKSTISNNNLSKDEIYRSDCIRQLFVNKTMFKHLSTTTESMILDSIDAFDTSNQTLLYNTEFEKYWNAINSKSKNRPVTESFEIPTLSQSESTSQSQLEPSTKKRKFQGLLRRQRKQNTS